MLLSVLRGLGGSTMAFYQMKHSLAAAFWCKMQMPDGDV